MRNAPWTRALAVALAAASLGAGCDRPPDEAWMRLLGFRSPGGSASITLLEGKLLDETTMAVDAAFENRSAQSTRGTGVLIDRARVQYRLSGATPPTYEYPVTLYLPPAAKTGEVTTGTVSGLPIVPRDFKQWIVTSGLQRHPEIRLTAVVTFYGSTDEETALETGGSLAIALANSGGSEELPVVSIVATSPLATESPVTSGVFTVSRAGSTTASLPVTYTIAGTATNGQDYQRLDGSVVLPAGKDSATVVVVPVADAATEGSESVILTLAPDESYKVGAAGTATVTIQD